MMSAEAQDRVSQAGDYVLGTLEGVHKLTFESWLAQDAALQAEVYFWQDQLLPLAAHIPAVMPSAGLWSLIEGQLQGGRRNGGPRHSGHLSQALAANDSRWQSVGFWRWTTGVSMAAVILLSLTLVWRQPQGVPEVRYVAVLMSPADQSTGWVVRASAHELRLVPTGPALTATVPAGKTLQFWTKPEGASKPTSLGLVRPGQPIVVPLERLPGLGQRQLFELTLEPEGGSTIGKPTGPIQFIGRAVQL
jgi:anti-sigma-K factor RskA